MNQEILRVSKNNHSNQKALQLIWTQLARICCGRSKKCFVYGFVFQVISEKKNTVQQRFYKEFQRHFCLAALKFIPDWFVASKTLEKFHDSLILVYSFLMKILAQSHFLPMKWVFLVQILIKLILMMTKIFMKIFLILLFMSDF